MKNINILAIETSGSSCSVAISQDNIIIAEYSVFGINLHDKLVSELIRRITNDTDINLNDINAVAVSSGPGSYTGLRIGGAIAKGLCYNNQPQLISVPTLTAQAFRVAAIANKLGCINILSAVPSHKNLLYFQLFESNAERITDISLSSFDDYPIESQDDLLFVTPTSVSNALLIKHYIIQELNASMIANFAYKKYINNEFTLSENFTPLYVQEFSPKY